MKRFTLLMVLLFSSARVMAAGETISANMGLVIPGVGTTAGPQWATDLNSSLTILDAHNHTPGSGVQVPSAGININSDLSFNNTNISLPRSVRFTSQGAPISGVNDISTSYVSNGDLYFNDGNGNQIRITQSGAVSGAAGTITGLPSGSASASFSAAQGTFTFQQATSTGANMDIGTLIFRYPGSYPTPSGNYIAIEAPASLASGFAFILPNNTPGTNQSAIVSDTSGVLSYMNPNAIGSAMTSVGANAIGIVMGVSGANAIGATMSPTGANSVANTRTRSSGVSVSLGGVAISSSSGAFAITTSMTDVTNLSVTITTNGRPVFIGMQPDGGVSASSARLVPDATGNDGQINVQILRGATPIAISQIVSRGTGASDNIAVQWPTSSFYVIDFPAAGTYTYKVQAQRVAHTLSGSVNFSVLVAYEL